MSDVLRELADELVVLGSDEAEAALVLHELAGLRDLVAEPASTPVPSPELAALLGRGPVGQQVGQPSGPPVARGRVARRSGAAGAALVALVSGVGATGLSAAANTLPAPVQERVASFSQSWLPFDLPHPEESRGGSVVDAPGDPLGAPVDPSRPPLLGMGPQTASPRDDVAGAVPPAALPTPALAPAQPRPAASPAPAPTPSGPATTAPATTASSAVTQPPISPSSATTGSPSTAAGGSGSVTEPGPGKSTGSGKSVGSGKSSGPRGWKPQVLASSAASPDVADLDDPAGEDGAAAEGVGSTTASATPSATPSAGPSADGHPGRHLGRGQDQGGDP